jgi:putative ABC transport system permease protein
MLALVLAAGGLYGVISYSVGQRSREIGVRMALGAAPAGIRQLVLADGFKVTMAGVAAGLVLGVLIARLASPILFGISATDPVTFALATAIVVGVSLASILVPAMRAMRVDPARTLRNT